MNLPLLLAGLLLCGLAAFTWRRRPALRERLATPRRAKYDETFEPALGDAAISDLAALLEVLPLLLRAGLGVFPSLLWSADRSSGALSGLLRRTMREVDLGDSAFAAIDSLAARIGNSAGREFAQKLKIAIDRGSRLADLLESQADGLKGQLRAKTIADAGRRESQILLPLVFLILPVTIAFAMYPSLAALSQLT